MWDTIDISGLSKADVLAALYNASKPHGLGFLQATPEDMTPDEAATLLQEDTYFDYLKGRIMKVDLGDGEDKEFRPWLYDRDNGSGAALRAIQPLFDAQTDPS